MNPDLPDARTNGGHRFPVVRIETLLDAPELEARVPPRIDGEGAQGGQGAAEPRDGLVRHASIYKFLYVRSNGPADAYNRCDGRWGNCEQSLRGGLDL
jgi:hypothetical protein